jgi:genome maintenance exonuclease 1
LRKQFVHVDDLDDIEVPQRGTRNGRRVYLTPKGHHYPSITSILGSQPKPSLVEWRNRIGDEEADRIVKEASSLGSAVHLLCERYLYNYELRTKVDGSADIDDEAISLFNRLRFLLSNIDKIIGLEIPLYSDKFKVAGTTDCIAEYNGVLSVIDFKTSKREKKEEWIEDYYIQAFFYAMAFFEMTGCLPEQIVILIAIREGFNVQVFKKPIGEADIYIDKLIKLMMQNPQIIQTA